MGEPVLFFDVDTQHDFMDADGRLPVPDAGTIVHKLAALTRFAAEGGIPVLASADSHQPDDPEFEQFGPHCVAGTPGQRKIEATLPESSAVLEPERLHEQVANLLAGRLAQLVIEKQNLDVFSVPETERALAQIAPERVILYGVTTEYCVQEATLGLLKRGQSVTVLTDAVKAIQEEAGERALAEMREAGAATATTDEVLRELAAERKA
jgi:nicotinamidase/pyrazinamidase